MLAMGRSNLMLLLLLGILLSTCPWGCSRKSTESEDSTGKPVPDGDSDFRLGQIEFNQGNYSQAISLLESASDKSTKLYDKSTVFELLGQAYRFDGKLDKAIMAFEKSIEVDSQNHRAFTFRGIVYRKQGEYEKAKQSYEEALKIKPESPVLRTSLGALAIFQKQYQVAVDHLLLATELDPSDPVAHSNLALAYAHVGKFDQAQSSLRMAVSLGYRKADVIQARLDKLRSESILRPPAVGAGK